MLFEDLINQHLILGKSSPSGWKQVRCAICNDHSERGAFKFESTLTLFNCFNCGHKVVFDESLGKLPSNKFKQTLESHGVPSSAINQVVAQLFLSPQVRKLANLPVQEVKPEDKPMPTLSDEGFIPIEAENEWASLGRVYLERRRIPLGTYPFFVSERSKYLGRLIVPYYYQSRLVYYQARSMDDQLFSPRYLNPVGLKDRLIFNHEVLQVHSPKPIYVTEGAFDALSIGTDIACGLTDSNLSEWKLNQFKMAAKHRKIVFVCDKNQNGYTVGTKALKNGFHIAVMPNGVADSNDCVIRYGHLWLLQHLSSSAVSGMAGQLTLKINCV